MGMKEGRGGGELWIMNYGLWICGGGEICVCIKIIVITNYLWCL